MNAFAPAIPAPLPHLSRRQAQACTTIAQRGQRLALELLGQAWWADIRPRFHPAHVSDQWRSLHLEWAGAAWALQLPTWAAAQIIGHSLGQEAPSTLPPSLADAVLEGALEPLLRQLQALGRGSVQRVAPPSDSTGSTGGIGGKGALSHSLSLQLQAQDGPSAIQAWLYTDDLGLLLLAGLLTARAPVAAMAAMVGAHWPITLHAQIGHSLLGAVEMARLQPGDWVWMAVSTQRQDGLLWLTADGRSGAHVQCNAPDPATPTPPQSPRLTVISAWSEAMADTDISQLPADGIPADSPDQPTALADVPIRLSFDVGHITLPLAQAQALQPGQVLDLGHPIAGVVRVRANGALIGEGDLVEIDGQLGVCVRQLFA